MKRWTIVLDFFVIYSVLATAQDLVGSSDHPGKNNIILTEETQIQLSNIIVNTDNANWTFASGEYPILRLKPYQEPSRVPAV